MKDMMVEEHSELSRMAEEEYLSKTFDDYFSGKLPISMLVVVILKMITRMIMKTKILDTRLIRRM